MKSSVLAALSLAALAAAAIGYWSFAGAQADSAPPATAIVTRATLERNVLATGVLEASQLVSVGARVSGQIETLAVSLGARVEQGDLIAQIDSDDQRNAVLQARAAQKQIAAQITAKEASIREAELTLTRRRALNEKSLTSTETLEAAEASVDVAQAELAALRAQLDQADVSLASAETELERTRILAPISGTVVAVVTEQGVTVNANTQSPTLVKIAALDRMVVKAEISEADIVAVKPGLPASFTLAGAPDRHFDADLRALEPAPASIEDSDTISTDTAIYYNALLDVDNPEGILRIGMTAQVTITLERAEKALVVPVQALGARDAAGRRLVQILQEDGTIRQGAVTLGLTTTLQAVVTEGLSEGDRLVLNSARATSTGTGSSTGGGGMRRPPVMGF